MVTMEGGKKICESRMRDYDWQLAAIERVLKDRRQGWRGEPIPLSPCGWWREDPTYNLFRRRKSIRTWPLVREAGCIS